jgi:hypothetical protein
MKNLTLVSVDITDLPAAFRLKGKVTIPSKVLIGVNSEEVYLTDILDNRTLLGYKVVSSKLPLLTGNPE